MKITVLGRGNAGCLTALYYSYYTRNQKDIHIELIHDPDIPPEKVGQATVLEPPGLLWKALGINWYDNPIDATPKLGILYENWGKKNHKFFHPFPLNDITLHYTPSKLQDVILESEYFNVEEKHINDYNQIDSDFIFDCRGRHTNKQDDYYNLINPVNSVLLGESNSKECDINWTRAVATPDGWTFVIPKTTQNTSYGYLYNDKITSIEEASANFEKLFDFSKGEIEKKTSLKFNNYIAKRPIIDDRIILGGNRLFFLEPLEATAIQAYLFWAQRTFWWIIDKRSNPNFATQELYKYTTQLQNFILWHYVFGSKYNTPFWRYAQEFTINDDEFHKIVFAIKKFSLIDIIDDRIDIGVSPHGYGQWMPWSFKNWYEGMKNDKS
ncbi:MAG: hypothetical protein CL707_00600 [Chloroflexi bacterium]|nr:hypothetical protein [Chloroflexota bacterium]|tara:strand:+ start:5598 stop:6743 length:1146 start_codon:yes stop_codon:yes gene_type:complete